MDDLNSLGDIPERVNSLRAGAAARDRKVFQMQAIRQGRFREVAPDLFSDEWPESLVQNTIDEAAKSWAAKLGMLPAINCVPENTSEAAKKRSDRRSKICNYYIAASSMPIQIVTGADTLGTFGLVVMCVYPDFENKMPRIKVESAVGTYPVWDGAGRTVEVARVYRRDWFSILADYPHFRSLRDEYDVVGLDGMVECVKYVNKHRTLVYLPGMGNAVLEDIPNILGECYYEVAKMPFLDEATIKGNYDDIAWVQLARHSLQMDLMSGIDQAVNAPIVVPPDVADVPTGPGSIIRTQAGPSGVGRVRLDMPVQAFSAVEMLKHEMFGPSNPESQSGATEASVITGRGLQELGAGYDGQIAVGQLVLKGTLERILSKAMKLDEMVFGTAMKTARGVAMGAPFEFEYRPKNDIAGHYNVKVDYGFAAGLDANRSLILLLQLNGVGALSKDTMMRNSPIPINVTEETQQIDIEHLRDSAVQAMAGYVQSIPQMAASGMDPSAPVMAIGQMIHSRRKGQQIEDAIQEVFAPKPPPEQATGGPQGAAGAPGFEDSGLPAGLQSNLATEGPNGRPDLQQLFAGIGQSGRPQLSAGVSRMSPVAGT